jgi:hypothetical protein
MEDMGGFLTPRYKIMYYQFLIEVIFDICLKGGKQQA